MARETTGRDKTDPGKYTGLDDQRLFFLFHKQKQTILPHVTWCMHMSLKYICFLFRVTKEKRPHLNF